MAGLLTELGHPTGYSEIPSRLAAVLADYGAVLCAVDEHDHPIGLTSLSRRVATHAPGPIAYVTTLASSSARGRGIGQLLVAAAKR